MTIEIIPAIVAAAPAKRDRNPSVHQCSICGKEQRASNFAVTSWRFPAYDRACQTLVDHARSWLRATRTIGRGAPRDWRPADVARCVYHTQRRNCTMCGKKLDWRWFWPEGKALTDVCRICDPMPNDRLPSVRPHRQPRDLATVIARLDKLEQTMQRLCRLLEGAK